MLNFTDVTIRRGPRVLFAGATFGLFRGEKIGITGENGSGKSSLMALVRGELHADAGTFEMPSNLAVAHVSQELDATEQAAIEFVLDGDAELRDIERRIAAAEARDDGNKLGELHAQYAAVGGYDARSRAGQLLHGLGFAAADEQRPVRDFSGGWRVRLNVAQALMCRSDLLLLDEPTNHLDLDAILWLEGWLRDYPGTLLLIAHDREFLDRVVNRIVNIEHGQARAWRGNYSAFEEQRAADLAQQTALYTRQQRQIQHMQAFVDRFRAQATKARQAQSRLKALERMQVIQLAHVDSPFEFAFPEPAKLPRPLLAVDKQAVRYGERTVLEGVSLTISPGDRIALLGPNGAGKSTAIKLLAGAVPATGGVRTEAQDLQVGYFAQHQLEQLTVEDSALLNLKRFGGARAARATEQELRDFLAGFGFRGDRVFEPVAPFSGGEKARLMLALVSYLAPNLLLLDEPTNHLDLEMRQALAMAMQDYTGAVVMVSHDRHLLRTVADQLYVVNGGRMQPFDGDLDDYAAWLAAVQQQEKAAAQAQGGGSAAAAEPADSAESRRQKRREDAERRKALGPLKARIVKAEKELDALSVRLAAVQEQLASPDIYSEAAKDRLKQLLAQQTQLARDTQRVETEWMAANEELEALQARLDEDAGPQAS